MARKIRNVSFVLALAAMVAPVRAQWLQWGGPNRDFTVDSKGLKDKWPDEGPKQLWKRDLGDGYATVVADGDLLFTMYRVGTDEFAIALDAKTGKTVWEHKNPSPFTEEMAQFGAGPHTTPTVVGDRVYTIGTNAVMHCFEKKTGKVLWTHDLPAEFKAPVPGRGYGASPIVYKNSLIVVVDREREEGPDAAEKKDEKPAPVQGQSLIAFDLETGSVLWKAGDYEMSYASPILINFAGEEQLVILSGNELAGLNPTSGDQLWIHPHKTQYGANLATPLWNGKDMIFCSAAYDSGSRAIKLAKKDGKTVTEDLWFSKKMRLHHCNAVQIGDYVFGSSGDFGPAFYMGVKLATGEIAWRERGFSKSTTLLADGKLIILDEDGNLALATATPEKFTLLSKCKLAEKYAWAAPTLVGTKLYLRDRKVIMALDLG